MKILKTSNFVKVAKYFYDRGPSIDDQPGFVNRDVNLQGRGIFVDEETPDSKTDIIKRWKRKRKKKPFQEIPDQKIPESSW
jgi:hypothetical protein